MELRAHNIMTVSCNDVDTGPALIIPDPHRLVIACRQYPRKLIMEVSCSYVVDMAL